MLEVALAVSVLAAVILVGLLISIGNERQRRAIEQLREDLRNWALGDLEIKREKAAREIEILDPVVWLNDAARMATGSFQELQAVAQVLDYPDAIVTVSADGAYLMFSPVQPGRVRKMLKNPDRDQRTGPLPTDMKLARGKMESHELSALTAGVFFDVEADRVWQMIAKRPLNANRIWVYEFRNG